MKNLSRQDKNGVRTAVDLERRYKFNDIDYTKEEIEKLKLEITTDDHLSNASTNPVQNKVVTQALNNKVNKETGKGLSANDYTDTEKQKLKNIAANAEENVIESISINGVQQEVMDKNVNIVVSGGALSILDAYPIGSIYMSVNPTNPGTLFGGTWESWGAGRVPVGIDTSQTEFNTVEKTGGEKTHTLSVEEIANHDHEYADRMLIWDAEGDNTDVVTDGSFDNTNVRYKNWGTRTNSTGGGQPHNNLQPYITCYMWKRTA